MRTIYEAIANKLKENSEIKWIDIDTGQLEQLSSNGRPPVAYPCVLISINIESTESIHSTLQACNARITLRYASDLQIRTEISTSDEPLQRSLAIYDRLSEIYSALQGFDAGGKFDPLNRLRQSREQRQDGLFVYRMEFETSFEDISNRE